MYYFIIGAISGYLTGLVFCKINRINFTKDTDGIRQGNIMIFASTIIGLIIGTYYYV